MRPHNFSGLALSRYELRLEARQSASLPTFLGSTLRGAFGHALKEAVCLMNHRDCDRCLVADRCIYPYLFETPVPVDLAQFRSQERAPHPFILAPPGILKSTGGKSGAPPLLSSSAYAASSHSGTGLKHTLAGSVPVLRKMSQASPQEARRANLSADDRLKFAAGDELRFHLTLMGRATDYLSYVIHTVSEMAWRGLGVERAGFALRSVAVLDECGGRETIYRADDRRSLVPIDAVSDLSDLIAARLRKIEGAESGPARTVKLRFLTPTRIRVEGDLQASLSFELLVRNLLRRVSLLMAVHGGSRLDLDYRGLIARAASVGIRRAGLSWHDWQRYSNRQETKMKLGGFVGDIEYEGDAIADFLPLLVAGEILHVGNGSSFGLGRYQIAG